jgi:hypothetical protein
MKVEFKVGQRGADSRLILDDVDVSHHVRKVTVESDVHDLSVMIVEYACVEGIVNGEAIIYHQCPATLREETDE